RVGSERPADRRCPFARIHGPGGQAAGRERIFDRARHRATSGAVPAAAWGPMKALVTGAAGYVGSAIVRMLAADPRWEVRGAVRQVLAAPVTNCEYAVVGDLGRNA